MDWDYRSERDGESCLSMEGERCRLSKGKVLGGSSSINLMHYFRGNPADFDEWERSGCPGWKFDDVLPYFKKSEKVAADFQLVNDTDYDQMIRHVRKTVRNNDKSTYEFSKLIPEDYHSVDGVQPVGHFSYDFYLTTLKKVYCFAADLLGMDCISDANAENQLGFVFAMGTVERGSRANTAKAFLNPVKTRSNLFVARKTHVRRVLMKGGRAVGVEVVRAGKTFEILAKKEVILSAGAFNSPKILMLSGIGPEEHLKSLGVPVAKNVPGVGENLQAHPVFFGLPVSVDKDLPEPLKRLQKFDGMYEFLTRGSGLYGNICMNDFVGFVATQEKSKLPDLQLLHFVNHLNDTYLFNELFRALGMKSSVNDQFAEYTAQSKVMLMCPAVLTPKSRGTVRLASAKPDDPPKITTNILKEKEDFDTLLRGIKLAVKLIKTDSFGVVQAELLKLDLPGCEDLELDTDEYWKCLARHMTTTLHNYAGTCKMGEDEMSVVDATLKVRGVDGLRVADSSIMPNIIRGSTHTVAIMIGEKVSDMIKDQWEKGITHDEM
ncbi:UNVERIFIED_CONTAM: hypothetical protein PYX00_009171 [Menopon gallinae]|uniref:Glucose-methanol-choline oxidoreductase N-terminal domain-containing protein n=1 Tax=Menopon gallinae TaxID=328185 RepID=A0AAW2HAI9_9NEOP